ncbi:translation initiation factor IF-2-like [Vidua chalybeata]|uniref:translation initiation factor IF-2-like n=1 Tax=Vidua chalybeata TaxID=81927 RepID=UPI0023A823D6|nr:translation initiation factor IF-2-like [Vidua chalybeata]
MPLGGGLPAAVNMYQNVNDEPLLNLVKGVTSAERAVGAAGSSDRAGPGWAGHGWAGPDHAALTSRVRGSAPRVAAGTTATSRSFERRSSSTSGGDAVRAVAAKTGPPHKRAPHRTHPRRSSGAAARPPQPPSPPGLRGPLRPAPGEPPAAPVKVFRKGGKLPAGGISGGARAGGGAFPALLHLALRRTGLAARRSPWRGGGARENRPASPADRPRGMWQRPPSVADAAAVAPRCCRRCPASPGAAGPGRPCPPSPPPRLQP